VYQRSYDAPAALPSVSTVATQDADRSILDGYSAHDMSVADRIADGCLSSQDFSAVCLTHADSNISSDCGRARGTAQCRATAGNVPAIVEQRTDTAAGDGRNLTACADFPLCASAHNASAVVDEGAATPTAVEFPNSPVPGLYLRNDRLINDRPRFGRRTDSVLADANDANAQFDEFGYLYDVSERDARRRLLRDCRGRVPLVD